MELLDIIAYIVTPDFCKGFIAGAFFAAPMGMLITALCVAARESDRWAEEQGKEQL